MWIRKTFSGPCQEEERGKKGSLRCPVSNIFPADNSACASKKLLTRTVSDEGEVIAFMCHLFLLKEPNWIPKNNLHIFRAISSPCANK